VKGVTTYLVAELHERQQIAELVLHAQTHELLGRCGDREAASLPRACSAKRR
jgi:hypothetical protein